MYKQALLKSLMCISSLFLKFLSADQLEQVITNSILTASEAQPQPGDAVEVILEAIASEAPNHRKLVLQATMNTYSFLSK